MASRTHDHLDLLVVGAGPTGLTAAVEARRRGLSVRVVERRERRSPFSKALVVHARTMEVFEGLGLAEHLTARSARFSALNLRGVAGARGRIDLLDLDWGDTDHPHWLTLPQYETERVLEDALSALGIQVEWATRFTGVAEEDDVVAATLTGPAGTEVVRSRWLLGADGGRSTVRDAIGGTLEREDAGATFILADAQTSASLAEDEGHLFLHPDGLLIIVPLPDPGRWRIIAHAPGESPAARTPIDAGYLDDLVRGRTGIEFGARDLGWTSRFALTHGVADVHRRGRVFLAGDAAHVHSPVGGQGLNTGVQDAHNLVWKLALADRIPAEAREDLLESYAVERRLVAHAMVGGVRRATSLVAGRGGLARRVVGALGPRILPRTRLRLALGRPLAGLEVAYAGGPLVVKEAPGSGARLANFHLGDGSRVLSHVDPQDPTWVVREPASDGPWGGLPLVAVPADADLPPVTLVRPDGHIIASGDVPAAVWTIVRRSPVLLAIAGGW